MRAIAYVPSGERQAYKNVLWRSAVCGISPHCAQGKAEAESSTAARGAVPADTCTPAIDSDRLMVILKLEVQKREVN